MSRGNLAGTLAVALATSPATAGPWTTPAGELVTELVLVHWQANERFVGIPNAGGKPCERTALGTDITGAELVYQQIALRVAVGVLDGVEVGACLRRARGAQ